VFGTSQALSCACPLSGDCTGKGQRTGARGWVEHTRKTGNETIRDKDMHSLSKPRISLTHSEMSRTPLPAQKRGGLRTQIGDGGHLRLRPHGVGIQRRKPQRREAPAPAPAPGEAEKASLREGILHAGVCVRGVSEAERGLQRGAQRECPSSPQGPPHSEGHPRPVFPLACKELLAPCFRDSL